MFKDSAIILDAIRQSFSTKSATAEMFTSVRVVFGRLPLLSTSTSSRTYSMEQSRAWRADQSLQLVKKFSAFLWNPKVLYRTHKCPPPVLILSQLHPVPTTPSNFLKIHLNIILPSTSGSPQWPFSLRVPHQHHVHPSLLPHTHHMPGPSYSLPSRNREYHLKYFYCFRASFPINLLYRY
jgi:hypothetical protein